MGMANLPIGEGTQNQPMFPAPYLVHHNQQPAIRPQFPAQPNPNPNNRPVQLIQIIENPKPNAEQKQCNELRLRSGRTILPIEATTPPQSQFETSTEPSLTNIMETDKDKETIDKKRPEELRVTPLPFLARLNLPRPIITPYFGILGELRNLCINIPLL